MIEVYLSTKKLAKILLYIKKELVEYDFLIPIESFFKGREEKIYHVQFYLFLWLFKNVFIYIFYLKKTKNMDRILVNHTIK